MSECKHCGKPIKFVNFEGKWKPTDPETGERHRCEIDQKCGVCGVTFKGAPWMKECSLCYRGELRKGRAYRKEPEEPAPAERLEEEDDVSTPF